MSIEKSNILDLGDYRRFNFDECIRAKSETFVLDEGGLTSPLSISLIIPTKFDREKTLYIETETLHRILSQCSELIDVGYLDEIIVIDASRKRNEIDFSILESVVKVAYQELGLFREQVDLLTKYKSQNEKAKRGLIDFFLKVVHQFDGNISKILAKYGVFGLTGHFGVLPGKGAALWLAVPIAQGDIISFIDADIMGFEKQYVTGLCHPIIYSWNLQESAIQFVKAYYTRITLSKTNPPSRFFGGRLCRLLAIPLMKAVTEILTIYPGLEMIKYPLAGEFAVTRDIIEKLTFPNTYAIETSFLYQIYDVIGPCKMAQIDLDIFHHIGQSFQDLTAMAYQIVDALFQVVDRNLGRELTNEERREILKRYDENVKDLIETYEKKAMSLTGNEISEGYPKQKEIEKTKWLKEVIKEVLSGNAKDRVPRTANLPPWHRINNNIQNYFTLKEMLRRRSNQSTWTRLRDSGFLRD
ncbi:MAG: mannosyl-3-phosphoglycerate synthase [Candidatus Ranarchaeia archaeon]